ncbi:MAG: PorT family protein [Bacteroidales bacterium]|nr:PorT family protein [Bacteroidales bacterium]
MKTLKPIPARETIIMLVLLFSVFNGGVINAQPGRSSNGPSGRGFYAPEIIKFGIHTDPSICWFESDIMKVRNDGSRPGFNFGLTLNRYFTPNYSFSTGISLIHAGGRLVAQDETELEFTTSPVKPGDPVVYKIKYLSFPVGLKLQTNQIGLFNFFTDLGFDPKVVIGGKADIPSLQIYGVRALSELKMFNLSYHITAGIEYPIGWTTAMVFGLNFENNFLDVTKDNGAQPNDIISHKILSFRIGINF